IAAAVLPASAPPATHDLAEEIVEDIGKRRGKIEPEAIGPPAAAVLEGGMAEAVVSGALLAVLQDVIGFADFLETGPAAVIVGVAVGMKLLGKLAIGALDLLDRGVLLATQHFVEIALAHGVLQIGRASCRERVGVSG